jgi:hypothetical protein
MFTSETISNDGIETLTKNELAQYTPDAVAAVNYLPSLKSPEDATGGWES